MTVLIMSVFIIIIVSAFLSAGVLEMFITIAVMVIKMELYHKSSSVQVT